MKTFFKLLIVVIIINGTARVALAAMHYFQFKEAAQQAVLFGANTTTVDIRKLILEKADAMALPLEPENVTVGRDGGRTWAQASYKQSVELFPKQNYPFNFSFMVEGYSMILGPGARK
jgi:hypothetical protein